MLGLFYDGALTLRRDLAIPQRTHGESLVKVLMAGICRTDLEITRGYLDFKGILGHEFVGRVEDSDDPFIVGKRVVGEINCTCGICFFCMEGIPTHCSQRTVLGIKGKDGAFAEYLTLPNENLHPLPDSIATEEAVFVEPLAACYRIIEQVPIESNHHVLVLGDGKLGQLCAQVFKQTGCQLVVMGKYPEKLALLEQLGIQTRTLHDDIGEMFDIVAECTGTPDGFSMAANLVKPLGRIVVKSTTASQKPVDLTPIVINEVQIIGSRCGPFAPAIRALRKREISVIPLISRAFPLIQAPDAFQFASKKRTIKVLLKMEE